MKTFLKKAIPVTVIIILLGCGPVGLINILDLNVSLKYEVVEPRAIGLDQRDLVALENHYKALLVVYWIIMIVGPAVGIVMIVRKLQPNPFDHQSE
jgi:hypothetical protein